MLNTFYMPPTNQHIEAARKVYETYWESYATGDHETFVSTIDEVYEMIGTSENEICHTKADGIAFIKEQIAEIIGKAELRNRQIDILPVDQLMLVNEHSDIYVLADSIWNYYSKVRISTWLKETEAGWKVVQQHGSLPDMRVQEGETMALEKISKENLELRDAVKRRTAELENKNRELEIEAALEKVRAVAMGIKKPEDMLDVCRIISDQLQQFGVDKIRNVQIAIIDENTGQYLCYQYFTPYTKTAVEKTEYLKSPVEHSMVKQMLASRDGYFIGGLSGKELDEFRSHRKEEKHFLDPFLDTVKELAYCFLSIGEGGLGLTLYQPMADDVLTLFKRFHQVFSLAYQRFRDIQKAEAQAREAQIELALERIRAQVTAMQESSDLLEIMVTMRSEFVKLGHEAHYFWHMRWLPGTYAKAMTSGDGTKIGMVMSLPRSIHGEIKAVADWEKGSEPVHVLAMDAETAVDYVYKMITWGDFEQVDPQAPTLDDIRHIGGLTFVMARTTHGEIGYSLPGVVPDPPKDAVDTLVRFAGVFDLAYKRFEDLKAAEQQAMTIREERDRLEIALNELHATQDQLVQQEKLASLGQLTAGIAHEIKNPLNFVNNFSEVSIELVDEIRDELNNVGTNIPGVDDLGANNYSPLQGVYEILDDIKSNLRKIHEHGTRANGIVTSMLQHSRGGSGKMEPTDLNALIREYVNLSFHGMRAGKHPINVDIQLDLDEGIGSVNLIGEDFSRVMLNLVNNAFDAMRQKSEKVKCTSEKYFPELMVRTKADIGKVTIEVEDNGSGIPEEIKDKILQPFFTTKKGTEGTGLGLSITNDIVKAHGGKLKVETKLGEGSEFLITLPL